MGDEKSLGIRTDKFLELMKERNKEAESGDLDLGSEAFMFQVITEFLEVVQMKNERIRIESCSIENECHELRKALEQKHTDED